MDPKRPQSGQNRFWEQNHGKRLSKIEIKIVPAKTPQNRPRRATHESAKSATNSVRECELDHPKTEK